jgi:protease-4
MSAGKALAKLFSLLWSGVDGLRKVLHLLLMLFIFSLIVSALSSTAPTVPGSAALVIRPVGRLVEQLAGDPFDRALAELMGDAEPQTVVQDVVDGLAFAKDDDRITSVVLDLSGMPGGGLSKLKRIGDAIDDFRSSGKTVIANADYYGQGGYYLASRADERNDMSEADREALEFVVDQLWALYRSDVEAARELEPGTIDSILENVTSNMESVDGNFAALALESNLVDGLLTRAELQSRIVEVAGKNGDDSDYPSADLDDYLQQMRLLKGDDEGQQNVAVVVAAGEILNGSQPPGLIGGNSTSSLLRKVRKDDSVKAVVLRVDSPGGSTFASSVILDEVKAIQAAGIPVVVSMGSVAASGGYWVSMSADKIYASPYTITGSIGIFGMFPTFQRSLEALGITTDGFGTTPWAGQFRPDRALSEDVKALFQMSIENGYDQFITGVADGRELDKEFVDSIAQGRVWTGSDAIENGLVDELGNLEEAILAAAELAELEADDYGRKYFEQELEPGEQLLLDLMGGAKSWGLDFGRLGKPRPAIQHVADVLENTLAPLTKFNDPKGIYSHCFCEFE